MYDLALLEEGLLAAEHILQEIFVDHPIVGQVVLDYIWLDNKLK